MAESESPVSPADDGGAAGPAPGPSMSESASDIELAPLPSHWSGRVKSTSPVASSVSRRLSHCATGGGRGHVVGGRQAMLQA